MPSPGGMQLYRVTGLIPELLRPPEIVIYNPAYPELPFTLQARLGPHDFDLTRAVELRLLSPLPYPGSSPAPRPGAPPRAPRHLHLVEG